MAMAEPIPTTLNIDLIEIDMGKNCVRVNESILLRFRDDIYFQMVVKIAQETKKNHVCKGSRLYYLVNNILNEPRIEGRVKSFSNYRSFFNNFRQTFITQHVNSGRFEVLTYAGLVDSDAQRRIFLGKLFQFKSDRPQASEFWLGERKKRPRIVFQQVVLGPVNTNEACRR